MKRIDRRWLLKSSAFAAATCVAGKYGASLAEDTETAPGIRRLLRENIVIDGVMQPAAKEGGWPKAPGEIKKLTGVDVCCMTVPPDRLQRNARFLEEHKDAYLIVRRAADVDQARHSGRCGVLLYFQSGFTLIDAVQQLTDWYQQGLRVFQPCYSLANELGGGSRDDRTPLSGLGKQALKVCEELGIVFDVSHCGRRTTLDAARLAKKPITANHCNGEAVCKTRRNKSDEELKAIADTGGVVGVMAINGNLVRTGKASADDFVRHVNHLAQTIGVDHVGIASDSYSDGRNKDERYQGDASLSSPERWLNVAGRLVEQDYGEQELAQVLGLNFRRVYQQVLD